MSWVEHGLNLSLFISYFVFLNKILISGIYVYLNLLQARKLEAQLDEQINAYRKLASAKVSIKAETAESDIESRTERLLNQLRQVNSQMQAWVSSFGSQMVSHTLNRHQEILQDLTQVFLSMRLSDLIHVA